MGTARELSGASRYWSVGNPGNRAARQELLEAVRAAARPQLAGGGDVLDCGCGNGWLLAALAGAGIAPGRLAAVDLSPERAAAASRRVPGANALVADACELPFVDAAFAAVFHVVSLSSLGGAGRVRAALTESARVLAPGGVLVVYEPRFPNPLNRGTRLLRRTDLDAVGLPVVESRSLTLLPPLGRRLGPFTATLHPRLSRLPPLRSHRLLALRRSR